MTRKNNIYPSFPAPSSSSFCKSIRTQISDIPAGKIIMRKFVVLFGSGWFLKRWERSNYEIRNKMVIGNQLLVLWDFAFGSWWRTEKLTWKVVENETYLSLTTQQMELLLQEPTLRIKPEQERAAFLTWAKVRWMFREAWNKINCAKTMEWV